MHSTAITMHTSVKGPIWLIRLSMPTLAKVPPIMRVSWAVRYNIWNSRLLPTVARTVEEYFHWVYIIRKFRTFHLIYNLCSFRRLWCRRLGWRCQEWRRTTKMSKVLKGNCSTKTNQFTLSVLGQWHTSIKLKSTSTFTITSSIFYVCSLLRSVSCFGEHIDWIRMISTGF